MGLIKMVEKKRVIYVTRTISENERKILSKLGEVKTYEGRERLSKKTLIKNIVDADGVISSITQDDPFDSEVLSKAKKLKIIHYCAAYPYDGIFDRHNMDIETATRLGIYVTYTPNFKASIADKTWALLLALARRVVESDKAIRADKWKHYRDKYKFDGVDVFGKTLGIIGLGAIGKLVVRRAKGFDMEVLYYDIVRKEKEEKELGIKFVTFETLLKKSDFVSLHASPAKLIREKELNLMKSTAFLINTARGPCVDQTALYKALKDQKIAGAALDVFETEPINIDDPLLTLDNVVVVPHTGSREAWRNVVEKGAENMARVFSGRLPDMIANPEVKKIKPLMA